MSNATYYEIVILLRIYLLETKKKTISLKLILSTTCNG
nr:MAG TPA: hypothetical protein [Caudoviricetes sp.]